jgi:diaminohydroxyphosphoribosylaminopyrimidine deaminase/5-amino-6-(5-phosphoribosylamino)uracil reductase
VSFSEFDRECMATALQLAVKGLYTTDPNPRVGCVIAGNDAIVGRGWHERAGGPHAEIAALRDAGRPVRGLTAYVTLEPCSHHGRTPPCVDALLEAGLARVVIASMDPNPQVNGSGMERLRAGGVRVDSGLLADEAEALNCGFFSRMRSGRPWVRVKSAISLDGRTALPSGESKWISNAESRADVQRWRARSSAILTGIGTVLTDDPRMNARIEGPVLQPLRVVADSRWRTPPDSRILEGPAPAVVAGDRSRDVPAALAGRGVEAMGLTAVAGGIDLRELLESLAGREINEVQVEAGGRLCGALLDGGLVDEVLLYQAPVLLGDGGPGPFRLGPLESMAQRTHFELLETARFGDNLRIRLRPARRESSCLPES